MDLRSIEENLSVLEERMVNMDSIALAWLRTSVAYYQVFVEHCDKFEAIFCIPFDCVKYDPILIGSENLCQFSSHENGNTIDIKLVRIGTISIEFSTAAYRQKMVEKLQVMKGLNRASSYEEEAA